MIESQYTRNVHKRLPPSVLSWKINDNFYAGVSDAFYRNLDGQGVATWIEYKYIKTLPKKETTLIVPNLSEKQKSWLYSAQDAGENAFVVIGYRSKGSVYLLSEIDGITKTEFEARLLSYDDLAKWISNAVRSLIRQPV
jgi:penicillin-binding protein-related factor A (putative recombinase)